MSVRHVAVLLLAVVACWSLVAARAAAEPASASGTLDLRSVSLLQSSENIANPPPYEIRAGTPRARAFLGDVNGDQRGDIAFGAPFADPGGRADAGSVYVLFGGTPGGFQEIDLANLGTRGYRIDGSDPGDRLGTSIVALRDAIGADGLADFAIGAPRATDGGPAQAGVVYLVASRVRTGVIDLKDDDSIVRLTGAAAGDRTGQSLATLRGTRGLLVGAPQADPGTRVDAGSVYVLTSLPTEPGSLAMAARLDGRVADARAGAAVGSSADIDGDGHTEVLVGAPGVEAGSGEAYIVLGSRAAGALGSAGAGDVVIAGGGRGRLGESVAGIGDINGDAVPDVAIGAPSSSPGGMTKAGSAYIVLGRRSPALPIAYMPGPAIIRLNGVNPHDGFGWVVAGANIGDDASPGLLVSAPVADPLGRSDAGAVYALVGRRVAAGGVDVAKLGDAGVRLAGLGYEKQENSGSELAVDANRRIALVNSRSATSLLGLPAVAPAPPAIAPTQVAGCSTARDIELVVDDSASMSAVDFALLRRKAIDALLSKPRGAPINLGAIEIGTRSQQVFAPLAIPATGLPEGSGLRTLRLLLEERIRNDAGVASYAAGLAAGVAARREASALVLITDGAAPPSATPLRSPGTRVDVLQLGNPQAPSAARLRELATATGGQYLGGLQPEELPVALTFVESDLSCNQVLTTRVSRTKDSQAPTGGLAPPLTAAQKQAVIAGSTLTRAAPAKTFETGVPPNANTLTVTFSFPPRSGSARAAGPRCVERSPVSLRGMRVFEGRRLVSRATAGQLRLALRGRRTAFGQEGLRARGRCGRSGFFVVEISGFGRLRAGASARAARASPVRWSVKAPITLKRGSSRRNVKAGTVGR